MNLQFRDGTWDLGIFLSVASNSEYSLSLDLTGKTVIDGGAHLGSASFLFNALGAQEVLAFEPNPSSFQLYVHNIYEQLKLHNCVVIEAALWSETTTLSFHIEQNNTGASCIHDTGTIKVPAIAIDDAIAMCKQMPYLIKLDIEGAERQVIPACSKWSQIPYLIGEYHCLTQEMVKEMLSPYYSNIHFKELVKDIGLFYCWRDGYDKPYK